MSERERERQTETDRQTDRQREGDRDRGRETARERVGSPFSGGQRMLSFYVNLNLWPTVVYPFA